MPAQATILKNIVSFTGLVVGVPTSLPHKLNVNGIPVLPNIGGADQAGFTVAADATNITVTRLASAAGGNVNIYAEHWHTIEDVTPPGNLAGLIPFFFSNTGASAGSSIAIDATLQGAGTLLSPLGQARMKQLCFYQNDFFTLADVQATVDANSTIEILNPGSLGEAAGCQGLFAMFQSRVNAAQASWAIADKTGAFMEILPGFARQTMEWRVANDFTPTALSDFNLTFGMGQVPGSAGGDSGLMFACGFARFGNGNWHAVGTNSAGGFIDTGVAPGDGSFHRFTIDYDPTLVVPSAKFFIDDVLVATMTANLPSFAFNGQFRIQGALHNLSGNIGPDYFMDYFEMIYPIDRTTSTPPHP